MSDSLYMENNISTHVKCLKECKEKGAATCNPKQSPIPELAGPNVA